MLAAQMIFITHYQLQSRLTKGVLLASQHDEDMQSTKVNTHPDLPNSVPPSILSRATGSSQHVEISTTRYLPVSRPSDIRSEIWQTENLTENTVIQLSSNVYELKIHKTCRHPIEFAPESEASHLKEIQDGAEQTAAPGFSVDASTEVRCTVAFRTNEDYGNGFNSAAIEGMSTGEFPPPEAQEWTRQVDYTYDHRDPACNTYFGELRKCDPSKMIRLDGFHSAPMQCTVAVKLYKDGQEVETISNLKANLTGNTWLSACAPLPADTTSTPYDEQEPVVMLDPQKHWYTVQMDSEAGHTPLSDALEIGMKNRGLFLGPAVWISTAKQVSHSRALVAEHPKLDAQSVDPGSEATTVPLAFTCPSTQYAVDCQRTAEITIRYDLWVSADTPGFTHGEVRDDGTNLDSAGQDWLHRTQFDVFSDVNLLAPGADITVDRLEQSTISDLTLRCQRKSEWGTRSSDIRNGLTGKLSGRTTLGGSPALPIARPKPSRKSKETRVSWAPILTGMPPVDKNAPSTPNNSSELKTSTVSSGASSHSHEPVVFDARKVERSLRAPAVYSSL
ncbi:hypothetical protein IAT40_003555 [Kwoniella sp. CBS 6097]